MDEERRRSAMSKEFPLDGLALEINQHWAKYRPEDVSAARAGGPSGPEPARVVGEDRPGARGAGGGRSRAPRGVGIVARCVVLPAGGGRDGGGAVAEGRGGV